MTNEIKKQFFDTFGIEPKLHDCNWQCQKPSKLIYMCTNNNDCEHCKEYPQITDRILLELICVCNSTYINGYTNYFMATGKTKEVLKEEILKKCIALSKDIIHQVRTLFEEEN